MFEDEIETDKSYFDGARKSKHGRGTVNKITIFKFLKRNGKLYTIAVPNPPYYLLFGNK